MILLLSTSDTDLLSARACGAAWRPANPNRVDDLPALLADAEIVVVRVLGGRRYWEDGIDTVLASGKPVVALGGEQAPDAEMMELSTVPAGVAAQAHTYLAQGGPENLAQLHAFLSDTVLLTGEGFAPPVELPSWGVLERDGKATSGPTVAVLYYRAQQLAGNTAYVETLCAAIEDAGGQALPVFCASLRQAEPALLQTLRAADAMVVTVLAAGGTKPANASAGGDDEAWDVAELAALDVPILQGLCLTSSRATWADSDDGLSPLDVATQVAVPEFDGRLITVPFSFKEFDADGLSIYVADPERAARVAGIALRHARLRHIPNADKRIVLMLSAYPTKHARIGNAVGLDTPASAVALIRAMAKAGYDVGELPGRRRAGRRRADPRADRGRRAGPRLADRGEARRQPDPDLDRDVRALVRHAARRLPQGRRVALGPRARRAVRGERRHRRRRHPQRQRRADRAAAARLRREPGRDLPRPGPPALAPLPRRVPLARRAAGRGRLRRRRDRAHGQARQPRVAAGQDAGHERVVRDRRGAR